MAAEIERKIQKRLKPLFFAAFFQGLVLWYAIEKLFMQSIGFNDSSIAVATSIYIVVMLIANIPLGVLADRWSRRGVLFVAIAALILSSLICGISSSFWPYLIGISVWGIFYAAYSGTFDSIIYDTVLEESGSGDLYEKFYGRLTVIDSCALIGASLLSSVVAKYLGLRVPFFITIPLVMLSFIGLYFFREPTLNKKGLAVPVGKHLKEIFVALSGKPVIIFISLGLILNVLASRIIFEFMQLWFIGLHMPVVLFGLATALIFVSLGASGFLAPRLQSKRAFIYITSLFMLFASFGLLIRNAPIVMLGMTLTVVTIMALNIILSRYMHDELPSSIRAGSSSVTSTVGYLLFVPVALGFGAVSNSQSIFKASWFVIGSMFAMVVAMFIGIQLRRKPAFSPGSVISPSSLSDNVR